MSVTNTAAMRTITRPDALLLTTCVPRATRRFDTREKALDHTAHRATQCTQSYLDGTIPCASEEEAALADERDGKEAVKLGSQGWAQLRGFGMAKKDDPRIVDIALQTVYKGTGNGNWGPGKRPKLERTEAHWLQRWQRWQRCNSRRKGLMAEGSCQEDKRNAAWVTAELVGLVSTLQSQNHNGLWSCRTCHDCGHVPTCGARAPSTLESIRDLSETAIPFKTNKG